MNHEIFEKRFIEIVGYYSGFTFANQAGFSTQVPVTIEIVSNESTGMLLLLKSTIPFLGN